MRRSGSTVSPLLRRHSPALLLLCFFRRVHGVWCCNLLQCNVQCAMGLSARGHRVMLGRKMESPSLPAEASGIQSGTPCYNTWEVHTCYVFTYPMILDLSQPMTCRPWWSHGCITSTSNCTCYTVVTSLCAPSNGGAQRPAAFLMHY